jgi:hypothetical protein
VSPADPILARRAQIARLVAVGKRAGYSLYGGAMVLFFVGFFAGYTGLLTTLIIVALVVGSLVLAPAIVFGYGLRAAEREERGEARRH